MANVCVAAFAVRMVDLAEHATNLVEQHLAPVVLAGHQLDEDEVLVREERME